MLLECTREYKGMLKMMRNCVGNERVVFGDNDRFYSLVHTLG